MNFFKKIFNTASSKDKETKEIKVNLSLDDAFVHNFIKKGGKFLYCTDKKEISQHISQILKENNWNQLVCTDKKLYKLLKDDDVTVTKKLEKDGPFFTTCEHLISDNGDILFSSNQLKSTKLTSFSDNFIVYATTSQLVKDTGQGLTGIKTNCKTAIPTNISAIKNYVIKKDDDNFLNYGNSNSKNLYLLLFEDL